MRALYQRTVHYFVAGLDSMYEGTFVALGYKVANNPPISQGKAVKIVFNDDEDKVNAAIADRLREGGAISKHSTVSGAPLPVTETTPFEVMWERGYVRLGDNGFVPLEFFDKCFRMFVLASAPGGTLEVFPDGEKSFLLADMADLACFLAQSPAGMLRPLKVHSHHDPAPYCSPYTCMLAHGYLALAFPYAEYNRHASPSDPANSGGQPGTRGFFAAAVFPRSIPEYRVYGAWTVGFTARLNCKGGGKPEHPSVVIAGMANELMGRLGSGENGITDLRLKGCDYCGVLKGQSLCRDCSDWVCRHCSRRTGAGCRCLRCMAAAAARRARPKKRRVKVSGGGAKKKNRPASPAGPLFVNDSAGAGGVLSDDERECDYSDSGSGEEEWEPSEADEEEADEADEEEADEADEEEADEADEEEADEEEAEEADEEEADEADEEEAEEAEEEEAEEETEDEAPPPPPIEDEETESE